MIKFINVSKTFGNKKILDNINLEIEKNKITCLIGESGCGKTTLLKMINRLNDPTSGIITINGKNILKEDPIKLRRNIGYVIQQTGLFPHMTIEENIEIIPRIEKAPQKVMEKKTLELMDMIDLNPNEYLKRYPSELSGGQQQRLCIARTLAIEPDIILMDEPTSALDPISTIKIEDLMQELKEKYSIIIVTHNMQQAARVSDKTAFFYNGLVIEYDDTKVIFENPRDKRTEDYVTGRFG